MVNDSEDVNFYSFDKDAEIDISNRSFPHWFQPGVAIFVTFRTADSVPKDSLLLMRRKFDDWLLRQSLPIFATEWFFDLPTDVRREKLEVYPKNIQSKMLREFNRLFQHTLDECHGECLPEKLENSKIISNAIRYFDGVRYDIDSFVIMPNHVHAIVQFRHGFDMRIIGQSWMRYTARQINLLEKRSGELWQSEAFDHIIRSSEQFCHLREYIRFNPMKARLAEGRYFYWSRGL
jgi:REP element-mobilizing transposase RayT